MPELTYQPDELIAKQNARGLLFLAIFPVIGLSVIAFNYTETIKGFNKNPLGIIFLISMLTLLSIFFWRNIFDKSTKLVINKFGIWTKKYQLIPWENVDAFYFEKHITNIISYVFWIDTKTMGESLKFDITFWDKDFMQIANAIKRNSLGNDIRYSGVHEFES